VQIYINDRLHTIITCSICEQLTANSVLFRQSTQEHPTSTFDHRSCCTLHKYDTILKRARLNNRLNNRNFTSGSIDSDNILSRKPAAC